MFLISIIEILLFLPFMDVNVCEPLSIHKHSVNKTFEQMYFYLSVIITVSYNCIIQCIVISGHQDLYEDLVHN